MNDRMQVAEESIHSGHFAKKQIFSKDRLIAWSHQRRFALGLRLAQQFVGKRVLDYGCGDGTFLALLMAMDKAPTKAHGAELLSATVADCQSRLGRDNLSFGLLTDLDSPDHLGAYDGLICMEVLEHTVDFEAVLDRFGRLLKPSGKLLISVPVETGLPLLVKQTARRVAGWRGIGDYPGTSAYTLKEFLSGVFSGSQQSIVRPVHYTGNGELSHDHKGFNWMALRAALARRFKIERTLGSPLTRITPHLNSQAWFIASPTSQGRLV